MNKTYFFLSYMHINAMNFSDIFNKNFLKDYESKLEITKNKYNIENEFKFIFVKNKNHICIKLNKINLNNLKGTIFSKNNKFDRVILYFYKDQYVENKILLKIIKNINTTYLNIFSDIRTLDINKIFKNNNIEFLSHEYKKNLYTFINKNNEINVKIFNFDDKTNLKFNIDNINILDLTNLSGKKFFQFIDVGRNIKNIDTIIINNNILKINDIYKELDVFNLDTISYNVNKLLIKDIKTNLNIINVNLNDISLDKNIDFRLENSMKFKFICKYFYNLLKKNNIIYFKNLLKIYIKEEVYNRINFINKTLKNIKLDIYVENKMISFFYKLNDRAISEIIVEYEEKYKKNCIYTIGFVSTKKEYRRFGISTRLFKELFKYFGHKNIFILNPTTVGELLYRKFGFIFCDEYKGEKELPRIIVDYDTMFWDYEILNLKNTMQKMLGEEDFDIFINK